MAWKLLKGMRRVHRVNLGLEPGHLSGDVPQSRVLRGRVALEIRGAEVGTKVEEVVLDARQRQVSSG